jgi:hypothetical protein
VPITKISEIIANEYSYSPDEVERLKVEVKFLLNGMEASQTEILSTRSAKLLSPTALENFFRNRERNEKIGQILQCLLVFLDHLPANAEGGDKLFNPVEQFRECVLYVVDLLLEADVKGAVFNEINQVGSPEGDNVWDYQERMNEKYRELRELLSADVKQGEVRCIRRSDIYIYILVRILLGRLQQNQGS